jgi:acyl-CoA thioesterase-1
MHGFLIGLLLLAPQWAGAAERWLVLGDSLSAAYGIPNTAGWVALLQQRVTGEGLEVKLVNASLSGETSSGGLQRIPALLAEHQPGLVIVELGANDALRGQNLRSSEAQLDAIISQSLRADARVVLLGVRLPTNYGPAYDARFARMYANLAERHALLFDPFFLEDVALKPSLMQDDGLHPNAEAQPLILARVWTLLAAEIKRLRSARQ